MADEQDIAKAEFADAPALTPAQWVQRAQNAQAAINKLGYGPWTAADHIKDFLEWCQRDRSDEDVVWLVTGMDNALSPNEIDALIKEYVDGKT